jgi:transposase
MLTVVVAVGAGDGRACYDKKIAEGKTHKAALRSLKRRISDAIYACLLADARRAGQIPPARTAREGNRVTTLTPARPAHTPNAGSSDKPLPDLGTTIRPGTTAATPSPPKPTSRKTLTTT